MGQLKSTCINCGAALRAEARHWQLSDRRKGVQGTWQLVECGKCGLVTQVPMPTDQQLATYYASYYSKSDTIDLAPRTGSRFPALRKLFHRLSGVVDPRDFVHVPTGGRVLDFGCGHAGYLSDFHQRGVAISGAEIAADVVEACRGQGYDVHKVDDFSHIPFGNAEFDVVYLMQVFEHLRDPHQFMQELARILKVGGVLYLAVPNASSVWRTVFGTNWVSGWFAPFHLLHYSAQTLSNLAQQHGFNTLNTWSCTPESWFRLNLKASLHPDETKLHALRSKLDSALLRIPLMILLRVVELFVRERDCLVVVLKKQAA